MCVYACDRMKIKIKNRNAHTELLTSSSLKSLSGAILKEGDC